MLSRSSVLAVAIAAFGLAAAYPAGAAPFGVDPARPKNGQSVARPAGGNPVLSRPARPAFNKPVSPVVTRPANPVIAKPVFTRPSNPVVTKPAGPVATRPSNPAVAKPVFTKPTNPVFTKPATPVLSKPATPVLTNPANPGGLAAKPDVSAVSKRPLGKQCGVAGKPACTPGPELSLQEKVELAKQNGMPPKVIAVLEEQARQAKPIRPLGKQCGVAGKPACTPGPKLSLQESVELAKQQGMSPKIIAVLEAKAAQERAQKEQAQKEQAQKDQGGGGANADQGGGDGKGSKVFIITPPIAFPGGPFAPAYQPAESPVYAPARPAPGYVPAPAPVYVPARPAPVAPSAAASCLTKDYLQSSIVLFRDTCTKEWAMNTSAEQRPVTAASARTCLAKENLTGGVVLFRDLCSGEWAKNPDQQAENTPAR